MILSDKDLRNRIIQDPQVAKEAKEWWRKGEWDKIENKIIMDPFNTYALGPCCYGLSAGKEYVSLREPHTTKYLKEGEHFSIGPSETVLILTQEYICLPRNILAMIVPRATWIFEGISLSATRIDPTWYGKLLIGFTNLAKNPVALDYGEEFCTCYFMETTETGKVLTPETTSSLGRESIGSIKFAHAREQKLLLPDRVTKGDIDKVADLYGWPWDVVRGMFDLTRKEIGIWIEKEVTSDIVGEATSAAERSAFNDLKMLYREQTNLLRVLVIGILTILAGAVLAYYLFK